MRIVLRSLGVEEGERSRYVVVPSDAILSKIESTLFSKRLDRDLGQYIGNFWCEASRREAGRKFAG